MFQLKAFQFESKMKRNRKNRAFINKNCWRNAHSIGELKQKKIRRNFVHGKIWNEYIAHTYVYTKQQNYTVANVKMKRSSIMFDLIEFQCKHWNLCRLSEDFQLFLVEQNEIEQNEMSKRTSNRMFQSKKKMEIKIKPESSISLPVSRFVWLLCIHSIGWTSRAMPCRVDSSRNGFAMKREEARTEFPFWLWYKL